MEATEKLLRAIKHVCRIEHGENVAGSLIDIVELHQDPPRVPNSSCGRAFSSANKPDDLDVWRRARLR